MTLAELQIGVIAAVAGNIAFIAALSFFPAVREKLTNILVGW